MSKNIINNPHRVKQKMVHYNMQVVIIALSHTQGIIGIIIGAPFEPFLFMSLETNQLRDKEKKDKETEEVSTS